MATSIKILIDEPTLDPSEEFTQIAETTSKIIQNSEPKFTLGIYGEWGTGKSTLMKCIQSKLESENPEKILSVWFNAWRFEREENFATIALMKTIGYQMAKNEKFSTLSQSILRGMKIVGKDLFRKAALETILTEKGIDEIESSLTEKMEFLERLDKDTIYFDGIQTISEEFQKIRKLKKDKDYRVVVFIDDLDRCSPEKALEVLESVKVFLDIEGFVYVIGISVETLNRLISFAYKEAGIQGTEYIKKIIQIPIKIPTWDNEDLVKLIEEKISTQLPTNYKKLVLSNSYVIARAVNFNPRQVKRFINNIILAVETFATAKKHSINLQEVFFVQVLTYRFPLLVRALQHSQLGPRLEIALTELSRAMYLKIREEERKKEGRTIVGYPNPRKLGLTNDQRRLFELLTPDDDGTHKDSKDLIPLLRTILSDTLNSQGFAVQRIASLLAGLTIEDWELLSDFRRHFGTKINWLEYQKIIQLLDESPYSELLEKTSQKTT